MGRMIGRPPLPEGVAKTHAVMVRLTADEKRALVDKARAAGVGIADVVRVAIKRVDVDVVRAEAVAPSEGVERE